jgi:branched-chain amino acid transport system substrate-binding protein
LNAGLQALRARSRTTASLWRRHRPTFILLRTRGRTLKTLAACAAFALCLLPAGCGSSAGQTANPNASQLTVYSSLPLAAGANTWAASMVNAEKLALKQARGQIHQFRISFYSEDDALGSTGRWDPGQTSSDARTAAQDHSTIAYIGDWDSGATAISLPLMNGSGLAQVSPGASYPGLTRATFAGKGEPDRYYPSGQHTFFRLVPGDDVQASALLHYMRRTGAHSVYLITDHDVFNGEVAQILAQLGPGHGLRVLGNDTIGSSDSDLSGAVRRAVASGADAVLFAGASGSGALKLIAQLYQQAPALKVFLPYATAQPALLQGLGHAASSLYVTTPALPVHLYTGQARDFARAYRQQFGTEPDPWGIYGYESMRLVLDAIRYAGRDGADHRAVITQLLATQDRHSVLGTYTLDPNGDTSLRRFAGERVRQGVLVYDAMLDTSPL